MSKGGTVPIRFLFILTACTGPLTAVATGDENLALNKPATCSSYEAQYVPELAVDGDTGLESRWGANPYPQWLEIDLEDLCHIDRMHLYNYWDGWRYYQYTMEVSLDDVHWEEVVDMSANTTPSSSSGFHHDVQGIAARFIRVNMLFNSANPGVHIVELEVEGTVLPPGEIEVQPAGPIAFGPQDIHGGPTAAQTVLITNSSTDHFLVLKGVGLDGTNPGDFQILSDSKEKVLGPLERRTVQVAFDPVMPGDRTAVLRVLSSDRDEPVVSIGLTGTGRGPFFTAIPLPESVIPGSGSFVLTADSRIVSEEPDLLPLGEVLAEEIYLLTGVAAAVLPGRPRPGDICLAYEPSMTEEAYTLEVADHVHIRGKDYHGAARGTVTLLQLLGTGREVPGVFIQDGPDSPYRAVSLDVARKYHDPEILEQLVEVCRFYKIRFMGLHLTDDQNFMFPSAAFPDLDHDNFDHPAYTAQELRELEEYAARRGVTLIPELDVPGHSSKMVQLYPQVFGSLSGSTIDFQLQSCRDGVKTIIGEMCDIFQSAPCFHIGGDESGFTHLPAFSVFVTELNDHVKSRNKTTMMWEGFGQGTDIPKDILILNWESGYYRPDHMLADGYTVINACWDPLYVVDHYPWIQYTYHTLDRIHGFDKFTFRHVAAGHPASKGITVPADSDVPGAEMCWWEGKGFNAVPFLRSRIAPFSARLWNPGGEESLESFRARYDVTDDLLEGLLFPVSISARNLLNDYWKQGRQFSEPITVTMHSERTGAIKYTTDGTEPTVNAPTYSSPFSINTTTVVKAALFDGTRRVGFVTRIGFQKVEKSQNITTGKAVDTEATPFIEHPASLVVDGVVDKDTYWSAYPNPQWIRIDLGAPCSIERITVFSRWGEGYFEQYTVEVSRDGLHWTEVADMSANTTPASSAGYQHRFHHMEVRYIRINAKSNSWFPSGRFPRIVEVRAE